MVGRDPVARLREAARVIADDVVAQTLRAPEARRDRQVAPAGELDRFLAADDWHPDWRVGPLHRPGPQGYVFVRPEHTIIGEDLLGPRPGNDVEGFLKAGARLWSDDTLVAQSFDIAGAHAKPIAENLRRVLAQ